MKSWLVRLPLFENFYFILSHSCGLGNNSTAIRTNIKVLLILFTGSVLMRKLLYLCKGMVSKTTVWVTWSIWNMLSQTKQKHSVYSPGIRKVSLPQWLSLSDFRVLEFRTLLLRMVVFLNLTDFWQSLIYSLVDAVPLQIRYHIKMTYIYNFLYSKASSQIGCILIISREFWNI